ncbi:MAG TPA: hypothetical protein VFL13_05005 [Candidatus Baltobacteraceae bacterium]|nr:hypothetical protein [Candidatus Baltobacteraceae bacterium]
MSYYVEMLRAKRALIVAAIILGILILTTGIIRIAVGGSHVGGWQTDLSTSPTAHTTKTTLPDGSMKAVVDDPVRRVHGTFVQHPDGSIDMDIVEPDKSTNRDDHISFGSFSMNEDRLAGGMRHVRGHFHAADMRFEIGVVFLVTIPIALIVATMLGGVLAKENDGHLDIAWTRPFSREQYALAAFGIDAAAIVLSSLMTVAALLICSLFFLVPSFKATPDSLWQIAIAFVGPIAWYALLTAASASLKRGPGLVCGLGWVVGVIVPAVAGILEGPAKLNSIANAFYRIFDTLVYVDPIAYFSFSYHNGAMHTATGLSMAACLAVLAGLAVGYLALSMAQWRRVEA